MLICLICTDVAYLDKYQTLLAVQHGGVHLVTTNTEFSEVTAPYL